MIYAAITKARNYLYEKEIFKSFSLDVPVVSIGNITVGGTGKTPLVAFVAEILAVNGEKVCVLSRGYGRENPKTRVLVSDSEKILVGANAAGDEPFELAQKLLGKAIVIADANRVSAGIWARKEFGITAFVLDDAFQHFRLKRSVDVITIDATNPFGNEKLLPLGILREPLDNLKRADAIVITRTNLVKETDGLNARIKKFNQTCPIFSTKNKISRLIELKNFPQKPKSETTLGLPEKVDYQTPIKNCLAFCALGNPNNFFEQLKRENFNIVSTEKFPDHHFYTEKDVSSLEAKAQKANAEILLTTAKDAVKLKNLKFGLPCLVVESEIIFEAENNFSAWLTAKLKN